MYLFAISDLHLPFGVDKPMNIFHGWDNYTERIERNWKKIVSEDDFVVIPGDISWAINLEQALPDFAFIHSLPGKKVILKGNHDYWWSTATKINKFLQKNNFKDISILHNDACIVNDIAICGTRGWVYDGTVEKDQKVILRECGRLETSIKKGIEQGARPIVFLHYPPAYGDFVCEEIFDIIKKYGITDVYYGHIHGSGFYKTVSEYDRVKFHNVSCDNVDFTPVLIRQFK